MPFIPTYYTATFSNGRCVETSAVPGEHAAASQHTPGPWVVDDTVPHPLPQPVRGPVWPFPPRPGEYPVPPPEPEHVPLPHWRPTGKEPAGLF